MSAKEYDPVNNPEHYTHGSYECIEVMMDTFGEEATAAFCLLNAFKYIWRAKHKNGLEDIKKAIWYLNRIVTMKEQQTVLNHINHEKEVKQSE